MLCVEIGFKWFARLLVPGESKHHQQVPRYFVEASVAVVHVPNHVVAIARSRIGPRRAREACWDGWTRGMK